ncbi:DUF6894 family protein [Microvirga aerilata]|uniref:DUF6894 family protein n=1 Tax=Microvirga aerilata TaxID=670292 RepID=UPI0035E4659F
MRCFFHLVSDHEELLDDEGIEVSDLESAKAQAMMTVNDLQREAGGIVEDWSGWQLNVVNADGCLLWSVPLSPTLH